MDKIIKKIALIQRGVFHDRQMLCKKLFKI